MQLITYMSIFFCALQEIFVVVRQQIGKLIWRDLQFFPHSGNFCYFWPNLKKFSFFRYSLEIRWLVRKIPPFVYRITTDEEKTFSKFWCANKSLIVWKSFLPFVIFLLRMRLSNITSQEKIPQNLFQNIPEEFYCSTFDILLNLIINNSKHLKREETWKVKLGMRHPWEHFISFPTIHETITAT